MTADALSPSELLVESLIESATLDAIRRIQDALRFCHPSQIRGLVRGLREVRRLTRADARQDASPEATEPVRRDDDAHHFIYRDEYGEPMVFEAPAHGDSKVKGRWLTKEESRASAASAAAYGGQQEGTAPMFVIRPAMAGYLEKEQVSNPDDDESGDNTC